MLGSGHIFGCCNVVSDHDIYRQCTAMRQENNGYTCKQLEHLCTLLGWINTCQHFQLTGGSRKEKKVATVSAYLFAKIIKIGNKDVLCELILDVSVPPGLNCRSKTA